MQQSVTIRQPEEFGQTVVGPIYLRGQRVIKVYARAASVGFRRTSKGYVGAVTRHQREPVKAPLFQKCA